MSGISAEGRGDGSDCARSACFWERPERPLTKPSTGLHQYGEYHQTLGTDVSGELVVVQASQDVSAEIRHNTLSLT
jgi:hypothetical protein